MAPLVDADPARSAFFDVRRDATRDALFAEGMNTGMTGYEMAIADRKRALFKRMLERLPRDEEGSGNVEATVVEVGMGTFPNADAYFNAFASFDCAIPAAALGSPILCDARRAALTDSAKTLPRLDIVGVDPNDAMEKYARAAFEAARAKGTANDEDAAKKKNTLRVARGVAEALPLPTSSADAVVCTLTLCSVLNPEAAVAEIRRVLKPGGSFVFVEHVLSDDAALRAQQLALDGLQAKLADGCHLNRQTLRTIQSAGFADFELVERFTLPGFGLISSQVAGIAVN